MSTSDIDEVVLILGSTNLYGVSSFIYEQLREEQIRMSTDADYIVTLVLQHMYMLHLTALRVLS